MGPGRKPERWFSHDAAQLRVAISSWTLDIIGMALVPLINSECNQMRERERERERERGGNDDVVIVNRYTYYKGQIPILWNTFSLYMQK